MSIVRYFSMFSGIGGFELGIQAAADQLGLTTECVGYSEIEPNAIKTYEEHFNHDNYGDATNINPDDLPDFSLLVAGFPCQAFSIAGKRLGFDEARGTLFFDIARILKTKRPRHFILENVKGILSHDGGQTIRVIINTLTELGYCVEWQVLNSKNHGVPQSRERIYIVGHLGGIPARTVLPIAGQGNPHTTVGVTTETAVARTFTAGGNSGGNHSGMTVIQEKAVFPFTEGTSRRLREITRGVADAYRMYEPELARTLKSQGGGMGALTGMYDDSKATTRGLLVERIRRLTPVEAERLQGFPDGWTIGSDTQRYRQCGNAVTVNVVRDVALRLYGGMA